MIYTVGEMAKRIGVAPSTLRYYDKQGLLPFAKRAQSGARIFEESDYEWLMVIECLKKTGMRLKDIRKFMLMAAQGDSTIDERLNLILQQRQAVEKQISELYETLDTLDFKKWYYETAKAQGTTANLQNMPIEQLPEKYRLVRKKLKGC